MANLVLSDFLMPQSQEEKRSRDPKYYFKESAPSAGAEEMRGKKRARAEDFL